MSKSRVNICGHPERKHEAHGKCKSCYAKENLNETSSWACEHTDRPHHAKGKCRSCYLADWRSDNPAYTKNYRAENLDKALAKSKKWYLENKPKAKEQAR